MPVPTNRCSFPTSHRLPSPKASALLRRRSHVFVKPSLISVTYRTCRPSPPRQVRSTNFSLLSDNCRNQLVSLSESTGAPATVAQLLQNPSTSSADLLTALLLERKVRHRQTIETDIPPETAAARLQDVLRHMWADSTLRGRQQLFSRLLRYRRTHNLPLTSNTALLFLESINATVQTRLAYAKALMALLNRLHIDTTLISLYASSLRALGAIKPLHQATPLTKEDLLVVANTLAPPDRAALFLAWKTASRWGEIASIRGANIISRTRTEIIVNWDQQTKSTRTDPYRASMYAVVVGDLTDFIFLHLESRPQHLITALSTEDITAAMRRALPRKHYSAHSIKHGAMNILARAAANNLLDYRFMSLLAKHKMTNELSAVTIRYVQDKPAVARLLGTQHATQLL